MLNRMAIVYIQGHKWLKRLSLMVDLSQRKPLLKPVGVLKRSVLKVCLRISTIKTSLLGVEVAGPERGKEREAAMDLPIEEVEIDVVEPREQ